MAPSVVPSTSEVTGANVSPVAPSTAVTTVETTGSGMDVVIDQFQSVKGLPSFATKIVGDEAHIVQRESWTGTRADIEVTISGKPGEMKGTAVVVESGGVTTETVDLTVKVGIPLVGGKIEGLLSDIRIFKQRTVDFGVVSLK